MIDTLKRSREKNQKKQEMSRSLRGEDQFDFQAFVSRSAPGLTNLQGEIRRSIRGVYKSVIDGLEWTHFAIFIGPTKK